MKNMFWPAMKAHCMFILHSLAGISVTDFIWLTPGKETNNVTDNRKYIFLEKYMVAGGHDSGGVRFLSLFLPSKNEFSYLNLSPWFSLGKSMGSSNPSYSTIIV